MSDLVRALWLGLLVLPAVAGAGQDPAATFRRDLDALTAGAHRLAGSEEALQASRYVEQRLRDMGLEEVYVQDFPVPYVHALECTLQVEGDRQVHAIYPCLPNHLQPVVTGAEGITAPTVYAGGGRLPEYTGPPAGRIVVLEFSAGDRWLDAFAMGAQAVIFIGSDEPAPNPYHHQNFPANLPRFYVPGELADRLGLRKQARTVTVRAAARWEMRQGRNVIGILRGTNPRFEQGVDEAVVLAAPLDSLSEVLALSKGARGAANCAALLSVAEHLEQDRPRRDTVFCFFDGDAWNHAGARAFYGALYRHKGKHRLGDFTLEELLKMYAREREHVLGIQAVLDQGDIFSAEARRMPGQRGAETRMREEARAITAGIRDELQLARMRRLAMEKELRLLRGQETGPAPSGTNDDAEGAPASPQGGEQRMAWLEEQIRLVNEVIAPLVVQTEQWSQLQRSLYDRRYVEAVGQQYEQGLQAAGALCTERLSELDTLERQVLQGQALLQAVGDGRDLIVLHLSLNLGDASGQWTFIHGYDSLDVHVNPDQQGHYSGIFQAIRDATGDPALPTGRFERRTTEGLYNIRMFAPGLFAHSGAAAGVFGVPNLAVMTPMDRRVRDGQPCDVVARRGPDGRDVAVLNVDNMLIALSEVRPFVRRICQADGFSLTSGITPKAMYTEASFSGGNYTGAGAMLVSAGSTIADRPARGAFVAVMRRPSRPWEGAQVSRTPPGFVPFFLSRVDANGQFNLPPLSREYYQYNLVVGADFNERGLIQYVSNTRTVSFALPLTSAVTNLFRADWITVVGMGFDRGAVATRALKAASTAPLNDDRSLVAESANVLTVFAPRGTDLLKVFNPSGMVVLGNAPPADPVLGRGEPAGAFDHWATASLSAHDLYTLNHQRMEILRTNRILEPSLDRLHNLALQLRDQAERIPPEKVSQRVPTMAAAAAVSRQVYRPLLVVLNDLVVAVVLLLLLAIPFAYALERLLIGTPHIYRQIGWFVAFFLVTFAVLFVVNPAFRIAATPIVIFLAFAIIVLSTLVIVIMTRKLQAEVRRMQGLGTTVHSSDVSRLGTMMAAVQMGISTMRRRPIRTLLTGVTVVLLTFTILTFASFSSSWGNRRTYIGPVYGTPRILVRHPLWSRINEQLPEMVTGLLEGQAEVVPMYWVAQTAGEVQEYTTAGRTREIMLGDVTGERIVGIASLVGLDLRDVQRLPALAEVLVGDHQALASDGVFLTEAVADHLKVRPGDPVNVDGLTCRLAGVIDTRKMTGYRLLERSSLLPVDYQASGGGSAQTFQAKESVALSDLPETESAQFVTFSADRTAILPAALARRLGGRVAAFTVYPDIEQGANAEEIANRVAIVTGLPTYVGARGGVYRLFFTALTEASGWRDLVVPVILGGLIIFATMLGSVSDREKEIYAFSALGLAPPHIASLFFAEASVYAVAGGMGGYLLGQIVARSLSALMTNAPTMNYSSTNAVATILVVMATVLVSTAYPAMKASRSANPGIQRAWRIGRPKGDLYDIVFPFTVSAYDITGVVSFLREHFQNYSDTALGVFATSTVRLLRQGSGMLGMYAEVALAPFDLGVSQQFALLAQSSEIEGIQEIRILLRRTSGTHGDWQRANRVFINELRKQLLIWRAVSPDIMERYRRVTLDQWDRLPVEDVRPDTFGASV